MAVKSKIRIIKDVVQRSPEWHDLRLGRVGGSEAKGLTTPARMKTLLYTKLAEITTGIIPEIYVNQAMQWGIDHEEQAKEIYEAENLVEVEEVGYVANSDYLYGGLSPDGLVGKDGAVEIKNFDSKNHCAVISEDKVPSDNMPQILWYFVINTKLKWVDFVSYDVRNKKKPYHCVRVNRKDVVDDIKKMDENYTTFEKKLLELLKKFE